MKVRDLALALTIAAVLWVAMEASVHVREALRERRIKRAIRNVRASLPEGWTSGQGARLGSALASQRPGR